jgi:hypothetical protein
MKPTLPHTISDQDAPGSGLAPQADMTPAARADRACCCPAQPVVRVIMPPTADRPRSVDLLLCGHHHYRLSRQVLATARARIEPLPGKADAAAAALLETVHRDPAGVR